MRWDCARSPHSYPPPNTPFVSRNGKNVSRLTEASSNVDKSVHVGAGRAAAKIKIAGILDKRIPRLPVIDEIQQC
jgi:hypothetical protein